jgi:uncharacterized membrane protein YhaH (DUF805 family)
MEWATLPLKKYAEFTGRARRKEYWMFVLLVFAIYIVAAIIDGILGMGGMIAGAYGPLMTIAALALLIPSIAVGIRRLHDTNRSGWWLLIGLIPIVGSIILLVFFVLEGSRGPNQYGPDPLEGEAIAAPGAV